MPGRDAVSGAVAPHVLAVIVTYHPDADVVEHAGMLFGQVDRVLVVDNTPGEQCPDVVQALRNEPWITVIRLCENRGIATALNVGLKYAVDNGYRWLLTMDQDSRVTENHVDGLLAGLERFSVSERVAQISPFSQLLETDAPIASGVEETVMSMTSGTLVRVDIAQAVGGFKDELFIGYVDMEFSLRLRRRGYVNLQVDDVVMRHSLGYGGSRRRFLWRSVYVTNYPPVRVFYQTRNRIYLARHYLLSDPGYVLTDIAKFFFFPLKVLLFEEQKLSKLLAVLRGIAAGVVFAARSGG